MDARLPLSRLAPALLMLIAMGAQADTATMGQVDLVAGRTLTLALDAAATRNLTSAAIMTTESGRLAQAPGVRATLGPARDGVRWLRISASATAATRQYQIHGVASRNFGGVVPLAVRVVAPPRAGTPVSRSTQWSAATATVGDAANIRNARPFRALTSRLASLGRDLPAVTVDLGSFGGTVPPPRSDNVYRPDVVRVVTAPNTQVTGVAPVGTATVGSELVISGQYLPADAAIRIGGTTLALLSVTPTKIRARLPQNPVTGPLVLVWPSGGQEAVLDDSYVVTGTPPPAAFASFEPTAAGQNYKNAYLLSLLSWLAYADGDVAVTQAAAWGLTIGPNDVIDVDTPYFAGMSGNTQALILSNANTVFVAFRGSTDESYFQDWLDNDLDVAPQPAGNWGSGVVLHHGFAEAMAIAYPAVKARIAPHIAAGKKLWITGHSLGGAIAKLTAYKLRHEDNIFTQGVHVFGAPPVGNTNWVTMYNSKVPSTYRWNIEHDPIPLIMPPLIFAHVGVRNNLYTNGDVKLDDPLVFVYVPSAASLENLTVTHMSYWCRLHEEVGQHVPNAALPPPPELDMTLCGG